MPGLLLIISGFFFPGGYANMVAGDSWIAPAGKYLRQAEVRRRADDIRPYEGNRLPSHVILNQLTNW